MFGFIAEGNEGLQIHNRIFEIRLTNYFVSNTELNWRENGIANQLTNDVIRDGFFDMELCLTKFKRFYTELYTDKDLRFLERNGKLLFLTYLLPLINGTGFYHFESQTRDNRKMDLVIDYLKQQFILEVKIWYGESRHEDGYRQLADYLRSKNMPDGYLLTFDFRKQGDDRSDEPTWIEYDDKRIFDVVLGFERRKRKAVNGER
jgi:hypothetical protein